jgi:hypothetical protein
MTNSNRVGRWEAQQFRASGLNLVIAAIVYWNSTYIADAWRTCAPQARSCPRRMGGVIATVLEWQHDDRLAPVPATTA